MEVFSRSNPYRGPVKGVVLDWAGTTVDYGCIGPLAAFVEVFRHNWVEVTIEEARAPMGLAREDHLRAMCRAESVARKWEDVHGSPPSETDIGNMVQAVEAHLAYTIAQHADLIPGVIEAVEAFRRQGIRIGSSTGDTSLMMSMLVQAAEENGYRPDCIVCASDVPAGRPFPWMCYQNAINLEVYPMAAMVKIGDTVADIREGLNAGMWTIGLTLTGNELGLSEKEIAAMDPEELRRRLDNIEQRFRNDGVHFVAQGLRDCPAVIRDINELLAGGERP